MRDLNTQGSGRYESGFPSVLMYLILLQVENFKFDSKAGPGTSFEKCSFWICRQAIFVRRRKLSLPVAGPSKIHYSLIRSVFKVRGLMYGGLGPSTDQHCMRSRS